MNNDTKFELAEKYLINRLEKELALNLFYHGVHHTRDDVLPAIIRLAELEGIKGTQLLELKTAALYHDAGYMYLYSKNEIIGSLIAGNSLTQFGYIQNEINSIWKIIMSTEMKNIDDKLTQVPNQNNILEKIMCDADLNYLGREDFFDVSETLRLELIEYGIRFTFEEWNENQKVFLKFHKYFTQSAKDLRETQKWKNLETLKRQYFV